MNQPKTNRAFSLLEVIIASLLFTVMVAMVLESQMGVRSYIGMEKEQNEMESIGRKMSREIINDLANAARFYELVSGSLTFRYPALVRTPAAPLVPTNPAEQLRKDQVEFVRIRTSLTANANPGQEIYANIDVESSWIQLSNYANAPYTNFLVLNPTATDGSRMVRPVWESSVSGLNAANNENPLYLRHFAYQITDVDAKGRGRLVRRYYNGTGVALPAISTWTIDKEIATGVKRFSVETYDWQAAYFNLDTTNNPKPDLSTNQIRFEITLERDQDSGRPAVSRVINVTAAMRSITDG